MFCQSDCQAPIGPHGFHPTHKLIILSGAPDRRIAFPELVRSRRISTVLTSLNSLLRSYSTTEAEDRGLKRYSLRGEHLFLHCKLRAAWLECDPPRSFDSAPQALGRRPSVRRSAQDDE